MRFIALFALFACANAVLLREEPAAAEPAAEGAPAAAKEGEPAAEAGEGAPAEKTSKFAHCTYSVPKTGGKCTLDEGQPECRRARQDANFMFKIKVGEDGAKTCTW